MRKSVVFCLGLLLLIFSGCQLREEIEFKEDFSGKYSFSIDMKELIGQILTSKMEANTNDSDNFNPIQEFKTVVMQAGLETVAYMDTDSLENVLGLKNLEVVNDTFNFAITITFEFDDLKQLNAFYKHLNRTTSVDPLDKDNFTWDKENKIFTFTQTAQTPDSGARASVAPQGIFDQFEINNKYAFPFKIKKVNETNSTNTDNVLELSLPFNKAFDQNRTLVVEFE